MAATAMRDEKETEEEEADEEDTEGAWLDQDARIAATWTETAAFAASIRERRA